MKYEPAKAYNKFRSMSNVTDRVLYLECKNPGIRTLGLIDYLTKVCRLNIVIIGGNNG